MQILAFGIVKEIFGAASLEVDAGETVSVASLKTKLEDQYPLLKQLFSFMIAVNGVYAAPDAIISSGDEVAIIPPVSGG